MKLLACVKTKSFKENLNSEFGFKCSFMNEHNIFKSFERLKMRFRIKL